MPGATAATGTAIPILGTNVAVAAVILVLGIVLFIVLCYIGMHTAVSALIASGTYGDRRLHHHHYQHMGVWHRPVRHPKWFGVHICQPIRLSDA